MLWFMPRLYQLLLYTIIKWKTVSPLGTRPWIQHILSSRSAAAVKMLCLLSGLSSHVSLQWPPEREAASVTTKQRPVNLWITLAGCKQPTHDGLPLSSETLSDGPASWRSFQMLTRLVEYCRFNLKSPAKIFWKTLITLARSTLV